MADTVIAASLTLDSKEADKSVKSFKQELKEANQNLLTVQETFGATSKEALVAAKQVANLKDQMQDAKEVSDLFDPGAKFQAFGNVVRTVAGGFTALTGTLALFGAESKDVEKALLKVQAALAITEGINTIADSLKDFQRLNALIQQSAIFQKVNAAATVLASNAMKLFGISVNTTSTAFKALKGAIIATGIGALLVVVGAVINALMSMGSATESAADKQARLRDETERLNSALQDQIAWSDRAAKVDIAAAKARGASVEELTKLERKAINDRISLAETALADAKLKGLEQEQFEKALSNERANLRLFEYGQQEKLRLKAEENAKKTRDREKAELEKKAQERQQLLEREKAADSELQKLQDQNYLNSIKDEDQRNRERIILEAKREEERILALQVSSAKKVALIKELRLKEEFDLDEFDTEIEEKKKEKDAQKLQTNLDRMQQYFAEFKAKTEQSVAEQQAADKAVAESKAALAEQVGGALDAIAGMVGRQTALGKIAALAQIAINTALGFIQGLDIAQKSAKATGPAAAFAFPIFYAQQVAAVLAAASRAKAILSSGSGSSGGSSTGIGQVSTANIQAPLAPQAQQGTTTLDQDSLNSINNATSRAYVLESDVSENQERIRRLNRAAKLGG